MVVLVAILAGISLSTVACAPSRPGLRPSARIVSADSIDPSTLIEYRTLTRDDFRAASPTPGSDERASHLGALLCASIGGVSDLVIEFQTRADADIHLFVFIDADYRARMDPRCSWWNADQRRVGADYVLEHEQIHFALLEISAREINREIAGLLVRVASRERAPSRAQAKLKSVLEAARMKYLAQSRRFDEQTSPRPDIEAQTRWRREVEARLATDG